MVQMKKILLYSLFVLVGCLILSTLFFAIRQGAANAEIKRAGQIVPASVPDLGTTTRLEILPLYEEDRADERLEFGHGVSYLIRTDSSTILMDVGNNPGEAPSLPAIRNLQELGIAWEEIDAIVISHPHPDHVGGLKAWQNQTISFGDFTGDLSRMPVYAPIPMTYAGATIVHSAEPTLIGTDIATSGVIPFPEVFPLSLANPKGYEQALVIDIAGEGLVMITGCGHPTLEQLVARAEALYGGQVIGVVGGLHYEKISAEDVQPHIQFIETRQPGLIALSPHDSSPEALEAFQSAFPEAYQSVKVGEVIQFP
jgi:7,8-dihydropterin-6-yl-methyl-4-(beta-D-ribofuranosyl)aminobenzene 5'-phosphate synthase